MIRLLLDQGLPRSTASVLRASGWDAIHVGEIDMAKSPDRDILDYARGSNRVCVTLDADFHAILAVSGASQPSVIRIRREGLRGEYLAGMLVAIWPRIEKYILRGAMVTVTSHSLRIRNLPV